MVSHNHGSPLVAPDPIDICDVQEMQKTLSRQISLGRKNPFVLHYYSVEKTHKGIHIGKHFLAHNNQEMNDVIYHSSLLCDASYMTHDT